jgi:hypothetical protein
LSANYSRGQLKIQQMAFTLVAIIIFFGLVSLFYFSIRINSLQEGAETDKEQESIELVRKFSSVPEVSWTQTDCDACVDLDKILILKDRPTYSGFWKVPLVKIEKIYPQSSKECTKANYPNCQTITLVDTQKKYVAHESYVSLCRHEQLPENHVKCELGKIIIGFEPT